MIFMDYRNSYQCINKNLSHNKDGYQKYSAGILPYSVYRGDIYFLLGKDRVEQTWSDFGGRCEEIDKGKHEATASREFFEETLGSVMDINLLKRRLKQHNHVKIINSKTISNYPYIMYLVLIPYGYYKKIFARTLNYLKYLKIARKNIEKDDIRWFSIQTLLNSIDTNTNNQFNSIILREVFKNTINTHIDEVKTLKN